MTERNAESADSIDVTDGTAEGRFFAAGTDGVVGQYDSATREQQASQLHSGDATATRISNWGTRLVDGVLYPAALFATPLFLASLIVYFIVVAFTDGVAAGVRSFAAVLLPLMVLTYVTRTDGSSSPRHSPESGSERQVARVVAFLSSLVGGAVVLWTLTFSTAAPIAEMAMSGAFSFLVFSYVTLDRERMMPYYFGAILGFLAYIIVLGFPALP